MNGSVRYAALLSSFSIAAITRVSVVSTDPGVGGADTIQGNDHSDLIVGGTGADSIAGGSYAEIDTFRNTIFLNGSGANLKAGVDELSSEYFGLRVGENEIAIDGASVDVLWAPAWG